MLAEIYFVKKYWLNIKGIFYFILVLKNHMKLMSWTEK